MKLSDLVRSFSRVFYSHHSRAGSDDTIKKQAVLVIHGIGEQRPMSTLRTFVESVLTHNRYSSKPDKIDRTYELRKLSVYTGDSAFETDFYEYYWAYSFRDSRLSQILNWVLRICNAKGLYGRLKKIQSSLVNVIAFGVIILLALGVTIIKWMDFDKLEKSVLGVIWTAFSGFIYYVFGIIKQSFVNYAGDAARYLDSSPENIIERFEIKKNGIEIIHYLHKMDYDRILIVGHSLGSIIGYEMMKHAWIDYNQQIKFKKGTVNRLLQTCTREGTFRDFQHQLSLEQKDIPNPWRITDFITLGSPLTYANFLLAENDAEFKFRVIQRELPVCPPVEDTQYVPGKPIYGYTDQHQDILHHAAMFALTKWTNIYFQGDIISGALRPLFGEGVIDKKATLKLGKKELHTKINAHTKYWLYQKDIKNESLDIIRSIIFDRKMDICT